MDFGLGLGSGLGFSTAADATKSAECVTSSTVVAAAAGEAKYEANHRVAGRSEGAVIVGFRVLGFGGWSLGSGVRGLGFGD
jgi:hypothetical protein